MGLMKVFSGRNISDGFKRKIEGYVDVMKDNIQCSKNAQSTILTIFCHGRQITD
jgi:hypothetical protein